ncbi:MAG TPA: VOC family protein [Ktedonosporobacter sp.]|nr:VOC family protein [Ktedonosporobacter sp.]
MKLSYLVLLSSDVPAAVRFWRDVMKLPLTYSDEANDFAAFDTGHVGVTFAIYSHDGLATLIGEPTKPASQAIGRQMYLSFPVDDVDATYAEVIEHGATPVAGPRDVLVQQSRLAHFSDPDGNLIEISCPLRQSSTPTA